VNSLCSPFNSPTDFEVTLVTPGYEHWLKGLLTAKDVNSCALYCVRGYFENASVQFKYEFTPPPGMGKQLSPRKETVQDLRLERREGRKSYPLDLSPHAIGKVDFEF